jgi:protein-S-isoprenylcysteine O-methyltransferase Ste14
MSIGLAESGSQRQDSPGIEAWRPAALQVSSILLGLVIHAFWPVEIPLAAEFGGIAIVLFLGFSFLTAALSFREFARAKTSVRPDRRANALIRTGPFTYSRNPLYVAVASLILGIGVWVNSVWIWAMVAPLVLVMNTAVIIREETHLEQRFGQEYIDYKKAVRRWL